LNYPIFYFYADLFYSWNGLGDKSFRCYLALQNYYDQFYILSDVADWF